MITDLDKYGFVALTIVVVLILFITMQEMQDESDPGLNGIYFDDSLDGPPQETLPVEEPVVVLEVEEPPAPVNRQRPAMQERSQRTADFDFSEEPVAYPGKPAHRRTQQPVAATHEQHHKVQKGETLSAISKKYYGTTRWWKTIADANPKIDPRRLKIGDRITIPAMNAGAPARVAGQSASAGQNMKSAGPTQYRVKAGDTLGKIASRFYGSSGKWNRIYAANAKKIRDPKKLSVGTLLTIP